MSAENTDLCYKTECFIRELITAEDVRQDPDAIETFKEIVETEKSRKAATTMWHVRTMYQKLLRMGAANRAELQRVLDDNYGYGEAPNMDQLNS